MTTDVSGFIMDLEELIRSVQPPEETKQLEESIQFLRSVDYDAASVQNNLTLLATYTRA